MSIPQINNIGVPSVGVQKIEIPNVYNLPVNQGTVPFILNIGSPVVDLPGCVEYHPDAKKYRRQPNLMEDDDSNTVTLCDGNYPTYNAMDYTPEDLNIFRETPPPVVQPPPDIDPPEVPPTGDLGTETPCPGPGNLRVGDLTQAGDEKVIGHELQGTVCVTLYEPTSAAEKFLPSVNQSTTTVAIAVLATAGAAATPLLLRVIKPVIKKLTTFVKKKLGKKVTKPSRQDIMTDKYREKKGLPPIKR
jgi:hypothetical protein